MNRGVSMLDTNNSNRMLVTFPHSKKYPYLTSYCLLANALYVGLNVFFDLSVYYYLFFVLPVFPFLFISLKSQKEKHKLEVLDDSVVIGETNITCGSLKKIVIHNPISIFFHIIPARKKKKIITIQVNKDEAKDIFTLLNKWAQKNSVEIEKQY
ncbi:hypothetical protein MHB56_26130 [Paenibacillus sp. FSL H8-0315]|jgi:hypothetical protein